MLASYSDYIEHHQYPTGASLVATENGRPAAFLISVELFDVLLAHVETIKKSERLAGTARSEEQFKKALFQNLRRSQRYR